LSVSFVAAFHPKNYQAFTNESLTMMYESIRGALAADDALKGQDRETRFRVRETPEWRKHAAALEAEMLCGDRGSADQP
jgi:hypothetical protein